MSEASKFERTTLSNGLSVISERVPTAEMVSIGVWVHSGARHESADDNGVSHYLEHMAFKGTASRTARDIAAAIEDVGGYINAFTAREWTVYYASLLPDDVPLAVDVLADVLQRSTIPDDELETERGVILQEIGQQQDMPDRLVFDLLQDRAFHDQPEGRAILGPPNIIERMPRETLARYLGGYTAGRLVLASSGRIDHRLIADLAAEKFGGMIPGASPDTMTPTYIGGEIREARDLEQIHVALAFSSPGLNDPDRYAALLLSNVLGGGMTSRLWQEIREKRGLAYAVSAFQWSFSDYGLFGTYAGTSEEHAPELARILCDEIAGTRDGISDEELDRARRQVKAAQARDRETTFSRADDAATDLLVFGHVCDRAQILAEIDAVGHGDIRRVAARVFGTTPTLVAVGPLATVPTFDDIAGWLGSN